MAPVRVSTIPPLEEAGDGAVEGSSDGAAVSAGGAVVAGDADAAGPQPSTNAPRMAPMTRVRMCRAPAMTHRVYACVQASGVPCIDATHRPWWLGRLSGRRRRL